MKFLDFLKDMVLTYKKGLRFDEESKQFTDCINGLQSDKDDLQDNLDATRLLLSESEARYISLRDNIPSVEKVPQNAFNRPSESLSDTELIKLAKEYEKKMQSSPFKYNFRSKGEEDIKQYLQVLPRQQGLVREFSEEINSRYNPETAQEVTEAVQEFFVKESPKYTTDNVKFNKKDFWDWESFLKDNKGDCDDVAGAMHVIINDLLDMKDLSAHKERLWFMINQNYTERHANNIWLADDGYFYTVESTIDLKGTFKRKWMNVKLKDDSFYTKYDAFAKSYKSHRGSNIIRQEMN